MKSLFNLFKIYNLKTLKKHKLQLALSIISIAIAIATTLSIQIITAYNIRYTEENSKAMNGGDINISTYENLSREQTSLLKRLKKDGRIDYTKTFNTGVMVSHHGDPSVGSIKLVDPAKYPFYTIGGKGDYRNKLNNNCVIVDSTIANKFDVKKGDNIVIRLGSKAGDKSYRISNVESFPNEYDQGIIGCILASKDIAKKRISIDRTDNIYIKVMKSTELNNVAGELKRGFRHSAKVSTWKEVLKDNKESIKNSSKVLDLMGLLTLVISGISIASTMLLTILKRQKDFCIFKVYGLKNKLLKRLMILEASIIGLLSLVVGTFASLTVCNFLLSSMNRNLNIFSYADLLLKPILLISVFGILGNIIFTLVPVSICSKIKAVSILREQALGNNEKLKLLLPSIFTIILLGIGFSIYMGSILGIIYTISFAVSGGLLYLFILLLLTIVSKLRLPKNRHLLLMQRNLVRQRKGLGISAVILSFGLIFSGTILNMTYNLLPTITKSYSKICPYNIGVAVDPSKALATKHIIDKENSTIRYSYVQALQCSLYSINEKSMNQLIGKIKNKYVDKESIRRICSQIQIDGFDIKPKMVKFSIKKGRWFNKNDVNDTTAVIGDYYQQVFKCKVNDTISVNINGSITNLKIVGIMKGSIFNNSSGIYVTKNTLIMSVSKLGPQYLERKSTSKFLIKSKTGNSKRLVRKIAKKINGSFVLDVDSIFDALNTFIQSQTKLFTYISAICILAALFLMGNITIMTFTGRFKEFMIIKAMGAKNYNIRIITLLEGVVVGILASIIAISICEGLSKFIVSSFIKLRYSSSLYIMSGILGTGVAISLIAILIVLPKIKVSNLSSIFREM